MARGSSHGESSDARTSCDIISPLFKTSGCGAASMRSERLMILEALKAVLDPLGSLYGDRRIVRFTVHRAFFQRSGRECFFLNVANLSRNREIEITHLWFETLPPIPALEPDRPLPKRLKPDESWETWIDVRRLPEASRNLAFQLGRLRLSSGTVIKSKKNRNCPPQGTVPGGPIVDS
jgi:hypothetical protein